MKRIISFLTILNIIFLSCNTELSETERKVKQLIGDTLKLPSINKVLYKGRNYNSEFPINTDSPYKIVTVLWGDCKSCIEELKKWKDFYNNIKIKKDIEIYLYLYTSKIVFFKKTIYNKKLLRIPIDFGPEELLCTRK